MRLALGAVRAVTDRAPGGRSRRERRRARERDEESTPLVSPSSAVPTPSSGTGGFCDGDDGVATCSRACRARWTCVILTAFTALAAVTYVTTTTARGGATSTLAPGRFFVRDARATGDANFCASTSETSDGRRGVTCASVCDAARAPEVFEVREAEEGVGGYATVSRVRANGETTRCATGWRDGGKASSVIACDDDGRGVTIVDKTTLSSANETRVRFDGGEVEKTTRGGRKKFMLSGDARGAEGEELVVTCRLFQRGDGWKTEQIRKLMDDGTLRERNVLVRPNEPDVVVDRFFRRKDDGK